MGIGVIARIVALTAQPQVIAKMKRAHLDLLQLFIDSFTQSAVPAAALAPLHELRECSQTF